MNDLDIFEQSFKFVLIDQYEQALSLVTEKSIDKANDTVVRMDIMFELGEIYYENEYYDFALDKVYIEGELDQPINYTESISEAEWKDTKIISHPIILQVLSTGVL